MGNEYKAYCKCFLTLSDDPNDAMASGQKLKFHFLQQSPIAQDYTCLVHFPSHVYLENAMQLEETNCLDYISLMSAFYQSCVSTARSAMYY